MGESLMVDWSTITNGWTGLNTESILDGSSGYSFAFDVDQESTHLAWMMH